MRTCDGWETRLDRYLDGELPKEDLAALEAHLKGCVGCATEALARRELQLAIRDAGTALRPTSGFRERMRRAATGERARVRPVAWALPLAAALLLGAGLLGFRAARPAGAGLHELVDLHVTQLASTAPLDVLSSDSHTVKPWFEGKVPFSFDLPDLTRSPYELLGGRVVYLDQTPAAHLLFRVRKHRISAFVTPDATAASARLENASADAPAYSFRVVSFTRRGLRWVIVGDTGPADLEALAALVRGA